MATQTRNQEQYRKTAALCLTTVLVVSTVAPLLTVGTAAAANAAGNASVSLLNPIDGEVTDHDWQADVPGSASGTLTELRLNYSGTAADASFSNVSKTFVGGTQKRIVRINGTVVDVASTSASSGFLNVTLDSSVSISGNENVTVETIGVANPAAAGSYDATAELTDGSTVFATAAATYTVYDGGFANGTVTDTAGNTLPADLKLSVSNATTGDYVDYRKTYTNSNYSRTLGPGTYTLEMTADGYETVSKQVTVADGTTNVTDFTLRETGYINGTVTEDGTAAGGVSVNVVTHGSNDFVAADTTAADGSYSVEVAAGNYDVRVVDSDYEYEVDTNVSVTGGATSVADLSVTSVPPKGTLSGTVVDPDGNPVSGVKVSAADESFTYFNGTKTDSKGQFTVTVPEGTYRIRADSSSYPTAREEGLSVGAGETTTVDLGFTAPAFIEGTVTNASGPAAQVLVVAQADGQFQVDTTDTNGDYNITAPAGDYTVSVFARGEDASSQEVSLGDGATATADFDLVETKVIHKDVTITSGPGDASDLGIRAQVRAGLLQTQLINTSSPPRPSGVGKPAELETLGIDSSTEFRMNVTVTNFTANSLLWGVRDAEWETAANDSVANATDITITGSPVTLQATFSDGQGVGPLLRKDPSDVQWPTDAKDVADAGFNQTVYAGVFDLSSVPGSIRDRLDGVSVTTNAQRFSTPTVVNDSLRVWIAGPSKTVDGVDHGGFYQATIPDAQLEEWGVDDPASDLRALYKGSSRDFTVEEVDGGARILIENISYSAGFAEVEADPSTDGEEGGDDGDTGGGSGSSTPDRTVTTVRSAGAAGATVSVEHTEPGDPVEVALDGVGTGAVTVGTVAAEFDMGTSVDNEISVRATQRPPTAVPAYDGATAGYLTVDVEGNLADRVSGGSFTVTLAEESLPEDPAAVAAYRYHEGAWERVETTPLGDGQFRITTPGYSTFAVVTGPAPSQSGTPTATDTPTATATATTATATATDAPADTDTDTGTGTEAPETVTQPTTTTTGAESPGFGVAAAVAALLAAVLAFRRR